MSSTDTEEISAPARDSGHKNSMTSVMLLFPP